MRAASGDGRRRAPGVAVRALLALFLVVGLAGAAIAGMQAKNAAARQSRQSFDQTASGIAARVTTALQRDADLTTAARAVVEQNPGLSNPQLASWFTALTPSGLTDASGIVHIQKLTPTQYYYFRVAIASDPTSTASAGTAFTITPSSATPPYCLTRLLALRPSLQSTGDRAMPPGLDWCATSANAALSASAASGQLETTKLLGTDEGRVLGFTSPAGTAPGNADIETLQSLDHAFSSSVVILAPLYGGSTPSTAAGRAAALQGWVGGIFDTSKILSGVVGADSGLDVTLSGVDPGQGRQALGSLDTTNTAGGFVDTFPTTAGAHWFLTVRQAPGTGTATGNTKGPVVGGSVALAILILFFVLRALAVSRRRALDGSAEQTGELHPMGLHDMLTGLPNRSLVIDRADQMLVRSRRSQMPTAALTLGIDRFKEFNDAHGRQTGDDMLRAIADRLQSTLPRGRHGGTRDR